MMLPTRVLTTISTLPGSRQTRNTAPLECNGDECHPQRVCLLDPSTTMATRGG